MSVREAIKNKWSVAHASFRRLVIALCDHEWEHPEECDHGKNLSKRYCAKCGLKQGLIYHRIGPIRTSWKDEPFQR